MIINKEIPLPAICFKIGKKEFLKKLITDGQVYFSPIKYFRADESSDYSKKLNISLLNLESRFPQYDFYREDPLESISSIEFTNALEGKVSFLEVHSHAFCFYGLKPYLDLNYKIDNRLSSFGNHFAFFDPKILIEKLEEKLISLGLHDSKYNSVKHYEIIPGKNIKGLTQFHKKKHFEYQSEYRILANFRKIGIDIPHSINIGSCLQLFDDNNKLMNQILPIEKLYDIEFMFE